MEYGTLVVPAKSSILRRVNYVAITAILAVIAFNIWLSAVFSGQTILSQQSTIMARSLVEQGALNARYHLQQESYTVLQQFVDNLAKNAHINDAVVYDKQGKVMAQSEHHISHFSRLESEYNPEIVPFIENIYNQDNELIGYLGIHFQQQDVLNISSEFQNNIWNQLQVMLLLAFLMGILASRSLAKMRYLKTKVISTQQKKS